MLRIATNHIDGIDELRHLVHGSEVELTQLDPGRLRGSVTHIVGGDFSLSIGSFSHGVRGRGVFDRDRATLGIAMSASAPMHQWTYRCGLDDVIVCPAGMDHASAYRGPTSVCALSVGPALAARHFAGERGLGEPEFWQRIRRVRPDPGAARQIRQLALAASADASLQLAPAHLADRLRRDVVEAFGAAFMQDETRADGCAPSSAGVVRKVEDFVRDAGPRDVHISELCQALGLTRRTLHRAFSDVLDMGPIAYLRKARLTSVRSILAKADPARTCIGDVAAEYGFNEPGRFSRYYRLQFGELPIETLRRGAAASRRPH